MKVKDINNIKKTNTKIIFVRIIDTKGSVPRNENVFMVVTNNKQYGTIGGGELEYRVTNESIKLLNNIDSSKKILEFPLGPSLGQCCGGYIKIKLIKYKNGKELLLENNLIDEILSNNKNLYIFGAGHVSNALMNKLEGVGFNIFVIDSRENYLTQVKHEYINAILAKNPEIIIKNSPPDSYYLIMTHNHQIDLLICASILKKKSFSFIGLIGSKTKKIRFYKRLLRMNFNEELINKIECPIGMTQIQGKEPDIIAISIIARLLEYKSFVEKNNKSYIKLIKG